LGLKGDIGDRGLLSGDDVIVIFLINLKMNVLTGSLPETLAPNPYCLKMEGYMVMVCESSMTNKRGLHW
jgi:hypothetical protein